METTSTAATGRKVLKCGATVLFGGVRHEVVAISPSMGYVHLVETSAADFRRANGMDLRGSGFTSCDLESFRRRLNSGAIVVEGGVQ